MEEYRSGNKNISDSFYLKLNKVPFMQKIVDVLPRMEGSVPQKDIHTNVRSEQRLEAHYNYNKINEQMQYAKYTLQIFAICTL